MAARPSAGALMIEVSVGPDLVTVTLGGDLDVTMAAPLRAQLARVVAARPGRLVFDLAQVGFIDCACARLIAGAGRSLPAGRRPAIHSASPMVRRVLDLSGLAALCEISG